MHTPAWKTPNTSFTPSAILSLVNQLVSLGQCILHYIQYRRNIVRHWQAHSGTLQLVINLTIICMYIHLTIPPTFLRASLTHSCLALPLAFLAQFFTLLPLCTSQTLALLITLYQLDIDLVLY